MLSPLLPPMERGTSEFWTDPSVLFIIGDRFSTFSPQSSSCRGRKDSFISNIILSTHTFTAIVGVWVYCGMGKTVFFGRLAV